VAPSHCQKPGTHTTVATGAAGGASTLIGGGAVGAVVVCSATMSASGTRHTPASQTQVASIHCQ
jgi:hypothetical protein